MRSAAGTSRQGCQRSRSSYYNTWTIQDPLHGSAVGEYTTRLLFELFARYDSWDRLYAFSSRLKTIYDQKKGGVDAPAQRCAENILQIMEYITSYILVEEWAEEMKPLLQYPDRPHACWLCRHWMHQRVPPEHLPRCLLSEGYEKFLEHVSRYYDWYVEDKMDLKKESPINESGEFDYYAIERCHLQRAGYCTRFALISEAHNTCNSNTYWTDLTRERGIKDGFTPRELQPPVANCLIGITRDEYPGYDTSYLIQAKLDAFMWEIFQKSRLNEYPENIFPDCDVRWLRGASLRSWVYRLERDDVAWRNYFAFGELFQEGVNGFVVDLTLAYLFNLEQFNANKMEFTDGGEWVELSATFGEFERILRLAKPIYRFSAILFQKFRDFFLMETP